MRKLSLAVLLALSGCGAAGEAKELYAVVADFFTVPASCYATPPTAMITQGPLTSLEIEVWDGPEQKAFLTIVGNVGYTQDMGDAPNVVISGGQPVEGTFGGGSTGWTFTADRDASQPLLTTTVTTKTHAALAFPRSSPSKGTLSLSSPQTCTGTGCGTNMPTCTIDNIPLRFTRLQVDYSKMP